MGRQLEGKSPVQGRGDGRCHYMVLAKAQPGVGPSFGQQHGDG